MDFVEKIRFFIDFRDFGCSSIIFSPELFSLKVKNLYKLLRSLFRVKVMKCPVCGQEAKATGKEFKFGVFDGKQHKCESCGKIFNAFYRDGKFTHTVPKAK